MVLCMNGTEVHVSSAKFSRAYLNEIRDEVRITRECESYQSKHYNLLEEDKRRFSSAFLGLVPTSPIDGISSGYVAQRSKGSWWLK